MWPKLWQVVLYITISILIDEGYGLMCLRCETTNVNGNCKKGERFRLSTKRYQSCYGRKPRCYTKATVDENGKSRFKRGCTLRNICTENDGLDIEYCSTCFHKYCNYHAMVLDQEVEDYLQEIKVSKNRAVTSTETATKQADSNPKTVSTTLSKTVTESLPNTDPDAVSETLPKLVLDTRAKTAPETVSNTAPETVSHIISESVPTNITEKYTVL